MKITTIVSGMIGLAMLGNLMLKEKAHAGDCQKTGYSHYAENSTNPETSRIFYGSITCIGHGYTGRPSSAYLLILSQMLTEGKYIRNPDTSDPNIFSYQREGITIGWDKKEIRKRLWIKDNNGDRPYRIRPVPVSLSKEADSNLDKDIPTRESQEYLDHKFDQHVK